MADGRSPHAPNLQVASPNGTIHVAVLMDEGQPHYRVVFNDKVVVKPSPLGMRLRDAPPLRDGFEVVDIARAHVNEDWTPVWGTDAVITNHYHEMTVALEETGAPARCMDLVVRVYDDGVAFRYAWPEQPTLGDFQITAEETTFRFAEDHTTWWIPDDYDGYEWVYHKTPLHAIREEAAAVSYNAYLEEEEVGKPVAVVSKRDVPGAVNTPVTLRSPDGDVYLSVHEANLTDYAGMTLQASPDDPQTLVSNLVPWPDGVKVKASTPHRSPWRTIQIADTPGDLIESHLLLNLNPPSKIEDPSWIEPMTYVGIWWGMHLEQLSWGRDGTHGATTARTKRYMDFAAEHNIGGVLVEGWNEGWESWGSDDAFDFTAAYPDFDLEAVAAYGTERGVALIGHHETGGDVPSYERQMEAAFQLYHDLGVKAVKTGYAGPIRPKGIHHHSQQMVNHYRRVVKLAAKHHIAIDAHEPIKGTGVERTWPNMMTREGVRGMEYNAWSVGNPPEHTLVLPFTRMLAGPLDYTPGIFDLTFNPDRPTRRVRTTLAKQLALMVILYSPLQMASDLVENYEDHDAFAFIEQLPADWSASRVLNAAIGASITIARQQKDGDDWFIGSATNETARTLDIPLDFLEANRTYRATIFEDAADADYCDNPHAWQQRRETVRAADMLQADLARSGGQAVILSPIAE